MGVCGCGTVTSTGHWDDLLVGHAGREIAQAGLWLASDTSSCVTGVTVPVDADYSSR